MTVSAGVESRAPRSLRKRVLRGVLEVIGAAGFLLFLGYASLIATSDPVPSEKMKIVERAIDVLDRNGFSRESFFLRHIVRYRATDNWWNRRVGHETAFAATNFPFEIITLYSEFFDDPIDDVERAAILLHEAYHLFGYGEEGASSGVWLNKHRIGWTRDKYEQTKVWDNVKRYTVENAPHLFQCGPDGRSDCSDRQDQGKK
jgi:hypothetical protein